MALMMQFVIAHVLFAAFIADLVDVYLGGTAPGAASTPQMRGPC